MKSTNGSVTARGACDLYDNSAGATIDDETLKTSGTTLAKPATWNDSDNKKYHAAYFEKFPGVWAHGDYAEITEDGGMVIYGRSDAVLNPGGVRIGTAEIYRIMDQFEDIEDSVAVGQNWKNDVRVILFVRLRDGVELDDALVKTIRTQIRVNTTPRHMPAKIIEAKMLTWARPPWMWPTKARAMATMRSGSAWKRVGPWVRTQAKASSRSSMMAGSLVSGASR